MFIHSCDYNWSIKWWGSEKQDRLFVGFVVYHCATTRKVKRRLARSDETLCSLPKRETSYFEYSFPDVTDKLFVNVTWQKLDILTVVERASSRTLNVLWRHCVLISKDQSITLIALEFEAIGHESSNFRNNVPTIRLWQKSLYFFLSPISVSTFQAARRAWSYKTIFLLHLPTSLLLHL